MSETLGEMAERLAEEHEYRLKMLRDYSGQDDHVHVETRDTLRALAAENAALRTERDKWRAAAVATEAMIKARGTNRDYWESRAEHAETERDAATARAATLAALLIDFDAALSNMWSQGPQREGSATYLGSIDDVWFRVRAALAPAGKDGLEEGDRCPICDVPLQADDVCATDIDLGVCHAGCLAGSPVVDLDTGDELPDGKVNTYRYGDLAPAATAPRDAAGGGRRDAAAGLGRVADALGGLNPARLEQPRLDEIIRTVRDCAEAIRRGQEISGPAEPQNPTPPSVGGGGEPQGAQWPDWGDALQEAETEDVAALRALVCVPMLPTEWQAPCPCCEHPFIVHDGMIEETDAGSFVVTGADRYPRCEECDAQFEIAEMACEVVPDIPPLRARASEAGQ